MPRYLFQGQGDSQGRAGPTLQKLADRAEVSNAKRTALETLFDAVAPVGMYSPEAEGSFLGYHRTGADPFKFFEKTKRSPSSFSGESGIYFSPRIDDPTASVFGRNIAKTEINASRPAPVSQVQFEANYRSPRHVMRLDPLDVHYAQVDPNRGGLVIANSLEDVLRGKTMQQPVGATYDDWLEEQFKALQNSRLFKTINPEVLSKSDVELLKRRGYDSFNYKRPMDATSSMPSQIVALEPKQTNILEWLHDDNQGNYTKLQDLFKE